MRIFSAVATMLVATVFASSAWPQNIEIVRLDPPSGETVRPGRQIMVEFNYSLSGPAGGLIFLVPLSAGEPVEHYSARSLIVKTGKGTEKAWFTVKQGPASIDELLFRMIDGQTGKNLFEKKIPGAFQFGGKKSFTAVLAEAVQEALEDAAEQYEEEPTSASSGEERKRAFTPCTGSCKDVKKRSILPDGTVTLECADGSSRTYMPDGMSDHKNPSGEACVLLYPTATQVAAAKPPDEWMASVARWITNANDVLLDGILAVAGAEAAKNYQEYEKTEATSAYDRADLRLRYLAKLTESK